MAEQEGRIIKAADIAAVEHTPGGSVRMIQQEAHGSGPFSVAISDNPPGQGAIEHRHSCAELFYVYEGRGTYVVGGQEIAAEPGDVVIVPPNTWHSFRSDRDTRLRHVAVFGSGHPDFEVPATD